MYETYNTHKKACKNLENTYNEYLRKKIELQFYQIVTRKCINKDFYCQIQHGMKINTKTFEFTYK